MFKRLWAHIPALYTGWVFFHIDSYSTFSLNFNGNIYTILPVLNAV